MDSFQSKTDISHTSTNLSGIYVHISYTFLLVGLFVQFHIGIMNLIIYYAIKCNENVLKLKRARLMDSERGYSYYAKKKRDSVQLDSRKPRVHL